MDAVESSLFEGVTIDKSRLLRSCTCGYGTCSSTPYDCGSYCSSGGCFYNYSWALAVEIVGVVVFGILFYLYGRSNERQRTIAGARGYVAVNVIDPGMEICFAICVGFFFGFIIGMTVNVIAVVLGRASGRALASSELNGPPTNSPNNAQPSQPVPPVYVFNQPVQYGAQNTGAYIPTAEQVQYVQYPTQAAQSPPPQQQQQYNDIPIAQAYKVEKI